MTAVATLSDPSDLVAAVALFLLAILFGCLPADWVARVWARKRLEVALIWAIAGVRRAAEMLGFPGVSAALHRAVAIVAFLCALSALVALARERADGSSG